LGLIGVLGKKRAGKDTVSEYVEKYYTYDKMALATPLKDICKILFNFTDEQLHGNLKEIQDPYWGVSPRTVFQYVGTDIFRKDINKIIPTIQDNFWINAIINKYTKIIEKNPNYNLIVSDLRFQNECSAIHKFSGTVIKISRPSSSNVDEHESEAQIDKIVDYDFEIVNDGSLQDLYDKIDDIMKSLNIRKNTDNIDIQ
jgi:hypothetical protein